MSKKQLALDLMKWHGGGGSPLCDIGSNLFSEDTGGDGRWDHEMVRGAIVELEDCIVWEHEMSRDLRTPELNSLIARLKELITTKVIFRVFHDHGDVIAFFPEDASDCTDWYNCSSYQHIGQHGGANYEHCVAISRPATKEEYTPLKQELESSPYYYIFKVYNKQTPQMREAREQEWRKWHESK